MLFKVINGKNPFDLNPELLAIEEFASLTPRQMAYVILATDYKSPFRKLSPPDKKFRAAVEVGYPLDKDGKRLASQGRTVLQGKNAAVEKAVKKYKVIQKDEDWETILGLSKLIGDVREYNARSSKDATEIANAIKFSKELVHLIKAKKEIEDILEMREDEISVVETPAPDEIDVKDLSILAQLNEEDINDD